MEKRITLLNDISKSGMQRINIGTEYMVEVPVKIRPILKIVNNEFVFCYIYFLGVKNTIVDYCPMIFSDN
jgi:hypothetical protein